MYWTNQSNRFAKRSEAETANRGRLQALPGAEHEYTATDRPGHDSQGAPLTIKKAEQILDRLVALKKVELKVSECEFIQLCK